jgi:hypothetical protein
MKKDSITVDGIIFILGNYVEEVEDAKAFLELFPAESICSYSTLGLVDDKLIEEMFNDWGKGGYVKFYTNTNMCGVHLYGVEPKEWDDIQCPLESLKQFSLCSVRDAFEEKKKNG